MCKHSLDKVWGGWEVEQNKRLRSLEEGGKERQTDKKTDRDSGRDGADAKGGRASERSNKPLNIFVQYHSISVRYSILFLAVQWA